MATMNNDWVYADAEPLSGQRRQIETVDVNHYHFR